MRLAANIIGCQFRELVGCDLMWAPGSNIANSLDGAYLRPFTRLEDGAHLRKSHSLGQTVSGVNQEMSERLREAFIVFFVLVNRIINP